MPLGILGNPSEGRGNTAHIVVDAFALEDVFLICGQSAEFHQTAGKPHSGMDMTEKLHFVVEISGRTEDIVGDADGKIERSFILF